MPPGTTLSNTTSSRVERADAALSLYHLLDPEVLANPYPLFARLRREAPVHWDPFLHAWVVTRYADVLEVLHTFSADRTPTPDQLSTMGLAQLNPIAQVMVKQMLFMDAPMHTRLRGLASKAFTVARVEQLRSHIREIVDRLLDGIEPKGEMDVITDFAEPLPAIVTAELMGVPPNDWQKLKNWSANFAEMLGNFQHNPEHTPKVLQTVEEMTGYFREAVNEIKAHPREGLIHSLLTAEIDGDRLTEEEVIANSIVTMVGGQETTTNLIGNGLLTLLRNPGEMERLKAGPPLIPSAVEEMLRYESPSQHTARLAPEDRELGGKKIQKRQAVIAVMAAANRDPDRFTDPDRFDITRAENRHLAFGYAAHFCFGAPLARAEGQIAFERLLSRLGKIRLQPQKLEWRTNLGLRGLVSLKVAFGDEQKSNRAAVASVSQKERAAAPKPTLAVDAAQKRDLLEKYLSARASQPQRKTETIARRPEGAAIALSPAQEELWKREHALPGTAPLYNECVTVRLTGSLDVAILERSLAEIIRRHEIWRTRFEQSRFEENAGHVVGTLLPAVPITLTAIDLRSVAAEKREAAAVRMVEKQLRRTDLFAGGPMVRPMLVRVSDNEHRLYLMAHLMVLDGVSAYQIFPSELASLYSAFAAGKPSPLAELPLQFSDFAHAQRERLKAETAKQTAYWRSQLQGAPALEKREQSAFRGVIRRFTVPAAVAEAIKRTSRQENSTLFLTLLAVFAALLRQRTKDNDDVVVGTLSPAGRKRSEFQGSLGYFLNPAALRFRFEDNPTFHELLGQARKAMSEAMANDDVPIEQLAGELLPCGVSGHNPFFSAAISLQPPMPALDLPQGLSMTVTTMDVDSGGSPWDLYLAFIDSADGLTGRVQFNPDLFDESGVENLINQFHQVAAVLTADSRRRISQLKATIQA